MHQSTKYIIIVHVYGKQKNYVLEYMIENCKEIFSFYEKVTLSYYHIIKIHISSFHN